MTRSNTTINGSRLFGANINLFSSWVSDPTRPLPPTNLTFSNVTTNSLRLNWQAGSDPDSGIRSYRVFRNGEYVGSVQGLSFTDTNLVDRTNYNYRLIAENGVGRHSPSDSRSRASVTTLADQTPPTVVRVTATPYSRNQVVVAFSEPVNDRALNLSNYSLTNGASVLNATLSSDRRSVTLTTSDLQGGTSYNLTVRRIGDQAKRTNVMPAPSTTTFTYRDSGGGVGLLGSYYPNTDFSGTPQQRQDGVIDFDWGPGAPGVPSIGSDNFSVRWTGQIESRFSETYSFIMSGDDRYRLTINGRTIVYQTQYTPSEVTGRFTMVAGQRYDIMIELTEFGGGAGARLSWQSPSQAREIVPASQLFPTAPYETRTVRTSFGRGADTLAEVLNPNSNNGADGYMNVVNRTFSSFASSGSWVRFDLSGLDLANKQVVGARFLLSLAGFANGDSIRDMNVYGVRDGLNTDNWNETGPDRLVWGNAPGNNGTAAFGDPTNSVFLGVAKVDNANFQLGGKPDGVTMESSALADFIRSDTDGLVTLFFKRFQPDGNENSLFHAKESGETFAPAIQLLLTPRHQGLALARTASNIQPNGIPYLPGVMEGQSSTDRIGTSLVTIAVVDRRHSLLLPPTNAIREPKAIPSVANGIVVDADQVSDLETRSDSNRRLGKAKLAQAYRLSATLQSPSISAVDHFFSSFGSASSPRTWAH